MNKRRALLILLILLIVACRGPEKSIFPGLTGPSEPSTVPAMVPTQPETFGNGSTSRAALLVWNTDSPWLALPHGLRSIGIPMVVTQDYRNALKHPMVLVYPADASRYIPEEAASAFQDYVEQGGTLVGIGVTGPLLSDLFGYEFVMTSDSRLEFRLAPGGEFNNPKELTLQLGLNDDEGKRALETTRYMNPSAEVTATYEDDGAAMLSRRAGRGIAIAIGIDAGKIMSAGYYNRDQYFARSYVGEYEPAIDVFLRLFKRLYRESTPAAVTLGTVPFGRSLTVLLTHDIDFVESMDNAVEFARLEHLARVPATYFVQTKYIRDFYDTAFLNAESLGSLKVIRDLGMEIGSHSVSHSNQFSKMDLGSGTEAYPDYDPYVYSFRWTQGGTILGELRVSKFLLEGLLDVQVTSFRPGHLSNPFSLPQALVATGYSFSSSITANKSLTHLPFRLTYDRGFEGDIDILEFPVTIEDELIPAEHRLEPALALVDRLRVYGGLCTLLIHPSRLEEEIEFERRFIEAVREDTWFSTVSAFGRFWSARDEVEVDTRISADGRLHIRLMAPHRIEGLVLEVPERWALESSGVEAHHESGMIILGAMEGVTDLVLVPTARLP